MINTTDVEDALTQLRALIEPDGGRLELIKIVDNSVHIRLILDSAECAECVMPKSFLQTISLDILCAHLPALNGVEIEDPRE